MNRIEQTQEWIKQVVVAHGFCPFAARELERGSIHYEVVEGEEMEHFIARLKTTLSLLDENPEIETAFLVFSTSFTVFEEYLDAFYATQEILEALGYEGEYQLASFHPNYVFAGEELSDSANFTNRSPYPMWHLLREASVAFAIEAYPDAAGIPERNIQVARAKGNLHFKGILEKIMKKV